MNAIKERPILFNGEMVRAILEDRKTVTRRVIKVQPDTTEQLLRERGAWVEGLTLSQHINGAWQSGFIDVDCPHGQPGDRLWVREAFAYGLCTPSTMAYRATHKPSDLDEGWDDPIKWTPSIHMPRWACRILLEITAVRVERLQDINDEQAEAEGCFFTDYGQRCFHGGRGVRDASECEYPNSKHQQRDGWMWGKTTSHEQCLGSARWAFANLWEKTGGEWDANPWVWCIEFKRVTP